LALAVAVTVFVVLVVVVGFSSCSRSCRSSCIVVVVVVAVVVVFVVVVVVSCGAVERLKLTEHVVFYYFDFEMCFAPQRLALFLHSNLRFFTFNFEMRFVPQRHAHFEHLNFQKWSAHKVLCAVHVDFGNVLRATTAWNFSCPIRPTGSVPAALTSLLSDLPGPQNIEKTRCFTTFLPFRAP